MCIERDTHICFSEKFTIILNVLDMYKVKKLSNFVYKNVNIYLTDKCSYTTLRYNIFPE